MKKKSIIKLLLLSIFMIGIGYFVCFTSIKTVNAGWTNNDIFNENQLADGVFDDTNWLIEDNIYVLDSKINFPKNTYEDAKMLNRNKYYVDTEQSTFDLSVTITIEELVDKKVGIGFGFERSRYIVGDENTNFIYIEKKDSDYYLGGSSFNDDANETKLVNNNVKLNKNVVKVELHIDADGSISVKADNNQVINYKITGQSLSGYFCFIEEGDSTETKYAVWNVSKLRVNNRYYDTPENVNIDDDFNDNDLDSSIWYIAESGAYMKGAAETNGELRFFDCGQTALTTKYQYSNFELGFDITDLQRQAEYNANGALKRPACTWFGFFCGLNIPDYNVVDCTDTILKYYDGYFLSIKTNVDIYGKTNGGTTLLFGRINDRYSYQLPDKYDIFNSKNENYDLNLVFSCIDGKYTCDIKWDYEDEYYHVFTYDGTTMTGYITIAGYGSYQIADASTSNFSLDNLYITNRDYEGKVTEVEKQSSNFVKIGDYQYVDSKSPLQLIKDGTDFDLEESAVKDEKGCLGAAIPTLFGLSLVLITLFVSKRRRDK